MLVAAAALTAAARVVGPDTVSAVLPAVTTLLTHPRELVRKKAVLALHRFIQLDPSGNGALSRSDALGYLRSALCDKDPSVMAAALPGLEELARADPAPLRSLAPSLVSILKQVAGGRLPKSYEYHRVPAPFIQVRLLKLLACLGTGDAIASGHMHAVVGDAMSRGVAAGHAAGYAVAAECVHVAACISPDPSLLSAASDVVTGFLASPSRNVRYVGVGALAALVRGGAPVSDAAQLAVVDCLEDGDDSLRGRTLDLLSLMATPANIDVIVDRLVDFAASSPDDAQRAAVALRVRDLGERYAPSPAWYVTTMDRVFEAGGDAVPPELAQSVARLVGDGGSGGADPAADAALRASAVDAAVKLLTTEGAAVSVPRLTAAAWVLGEFGGRAGRASAADVAAALAAVACRGGPAADPDARAVLVTALAKLAARSGGGVPPATAAVLRDASRARDVALAARAAEAMALLDAGGVAAAALGGCDDGAASLDTSFVDAVVGAALAAGAAPFDAARAAAAARAAGGGDAEDVVRAPGCGLRFEAYAAPMSLGAPMVAAEAAAPAAVAPPSPLDDVFAAVGGVPVPAAPVVAAPAAAPAAPVEPELTVRPVSSARRWGPAPPPLPQRAPQAASLATASSPAASTVTHQTTPSPRPPSAASPTVDPTRARLAASLFGSAGGGSAGPSPAGLRRSPNKPAAAAAASPATAAPHADLLGGLAELAAPAPPPAVAAGSRPAPPPLDLNALYGAPASPAYTQFGGATHTSPLGAGVAPGHDLLSGGGGGDGGGGGGDGGGGGGDGGGGVDPFASSPAAAAPPAHKPAGDPFADLLG